MVWAFFLAIMWATLTLQLLLQMTIGESTHDSRPRLINLLPYQAFFDLVNGGFYNRHRKNLSEITRKYSTFINARV